jgi:hypothetical protein
MQRQRSLVQRMPLLTTRWGFEPWYLEQMPQDLRMEAVRFLRDHSKRIRKLNLPAEQEQYFIPMGYRVPNRITGDLAAHTWVVELRSGIDVHHTLRIQAQEMSRILEERYRTFGLKLYTDYSPDRFNIRRGKQDIIDRASV